MERSFQGYLFKAKEIITKTKLLYLVLVLFLVSCLNDPVSIDSSDNFSVNRYIHEVDRLSSLSRMDDSLIYNSPLLYSGYINPNIASSYFVMNFIERDDFLSNLCTIDSIRSVDLIINSTSMLNDTSINDLKIEEGSIAVNLHSGELGNLYDDTFSLSEEVSNTYRLIDSKLEIDLLDDAEAFDQICNLENSNQDYAFSIDYSYDSDNSDISYIEMHSTNSFDSSKKPSIRVSYMDPDTVLDNRYVISPSDCLVGGSLSGAMYFSNPTNNDQIDSIYIVQSDIEDSILNDQFDFLGQDTAGPILPSENTNSEIVLGTINLSFSNQNITYTPTNQDTIAIKIEEIIIYNYLTDPSGDNYDSDNNSNGTEGNGLYDSNEPWQDLGVDACPDSLETGDDQLCSISSIESPYNINGTEGNEALDWTDLNNDGLWSDVSEGERWYDCGIDMNCNDNDESDNYNIDPQNDNYNSQSNQLGTEGNNLFDAGEEFFDIGSDGIENSNDIGEGNGLYDFGEPFLDTGSDGDFDFEESGYNVSGTENNKKYDLGEKFDDCGIDNICNDGDDSDNFNGDPNNDNYNLDFDTGSEGNGFYDTGEHYSDYGSDGLSDSQEVFNAPPLQFENIDFEFIINEIGEISFTSELDSPGIRISNVSGSLEDGVDVELSIFSDSPILGIQFIVRHDPISVPTHRLVTEYFIKYLDDKSFYSTSDFFSSNEILFQDYDNNERWTNNLVQSSGYGVYASLLFTHLDSLPLNNTILNRTNLALPISKDSYISSEGVWVWPKIRYSNEYLTPYLVQPSDSLINIDISDAIKNHISSDESGYFEVELYSPGITNNFSYIIYDPDKNPNLQIYLSE